MKVFAIVAAAGEGKRFKTSAKQKNLPKQFLKLRNKPIILYSLLALHRCKDVDEIIIAVDRKYFGLVRTIIKGNRISKAKQIVEGGKTRFDSVRNAFKKINASDEDLILIHDAARPMIESGDVRVIVQEAKKHGAVIYGTRISDTVKKATGNFVEKTVSRESLWLSQTPQVFGYGILKKTYKKRLNKAIHTDEASFVEKAGHKVRILEGKRRNIKITNLEDLKMAGSF